MSRFGLAAVLGGALVTAGQLPTGSLDRTTTAEAVGSRAAAPSSPAAGSAFTAAAAAPSGTVTLDRSSIETVASTTSNTTLAATVRRAKAIRIAKRYIGVRYAWGGTSPTRGFDCSGYVKYVWAKAGKTLPRTSRAQRAHVRRISRAAARPGDLVFFHSSSGRVYHVGIYAGHGKMYDSPRPGRRVGLHTIWSSRVSFGRV